ncbi:hypothetical protein MY1884_001448 [Beauveria asiatica]
MNSTSTPSNYDASLGPTASHCGAESRFDFTVAFQHSVLSITPYVVFFDLFLLMSQFSKRMGPAIKTWNVAIQKRVSVTSRVVGSIRETKMLDLVPVCLDTSSPFASLSSKSRRSFRRLIVYMNLSVYEDNPSHSLAQILTFGITLAAKRHAANSDLDTLQSSHRFTIMGLLMSPLANLLSSFPSFVSSLGIFERFENPIEQSKFHDRIVSHNCGRDITPSENTHSVIELSRTSENCITLRKACLSAEIGGEALLHDTDLAIKSGEVCVVSGKASSGKSPLLQALLGCTMSDFDKTRYSTVIKACDLDKDIAQLSDGDMTVLSTKCDSSSSGQRHGVALAGALYAAPPVFVIDDILASLDQMTRSYVWEQVFGPSGLATILAQLVIYWTQLETSLGAIARLRTFEQITSRELEKLGTKEPPFDGPSPSGIEIRNLWASYRSSALVSAAPSDPRTSESSDAPVGDDDLPVLRQLTVSIRPGEKVAICCRAGSGKSSLVPTLYQLLRYSDTTIIDGVDISLVPLDTLLAVAHRFESVRHFDKVLDQGV